MSRASPIFVTVVLGLAAIVAPGRSHVAGNQPSSNDQILAAADKQPKGPPEVVVSLVGTTWSSTLLEGSGVEYEFRKDGILHYTYADGRSWTDAHWRQTGDRLYMEINNKYAEYTAVIKGNRMQGTGKNVTGKKWTWHAEKK
jgi:hypothetical protein